jgi:hypothetical protein
MEPLQRFDIAMLWVARTTALVLCLKFGGIFFIIIYPWIIHWTFWPHVWISLYAPVIIFISLGSIFSCAGVWFLDRALPRIFVGLFAFLNLNFFVLEEFFRANIAWPWLIFDLGGLVSMIWAAIRPAQNSVNSVLIS